MIRAIAFAAIALGVSACTAVVRTAPMAVADEVRATAQQYVERFDAALARAAGMGAPLRALSVCRYDAVEIGSGLSRHSGWKVARVSLNPFNPSVSSADPWEQRVLFDFARRVAAGERAETLVHGEVVNEPAGRVYRLLRALPAQESCTNCHGPDAAITDAMRAELAAAYPGRRPIGLRSGEVAGAVSVRRPF